MTNSTKVFIAGSRRLSRLHKHVRRRIDNIVAKGLMVIVGDANGVDKAVQEYLRSKHYRNVTVFCMEGGCRNNVGDWPTQRIAAVDPARKDFAYYSTKDRAMADEADYGLMLWDGRSRGTLTSIVNLVRQGKVVVVYVASDQSFYTLRSRAHLAATLGHRVPNALRRIERDLQPVATDTAPRDKINTTSLF